jgi:hypothetical protein
VTDARALSSPPAPCGSHAAIGQKIKFGHGGARPGAGRPRKQIVTLAASETDPHWCVYQTIPQAERLAARELTRAGYRCYCPLIAAQRLDPVRFTPQRGLVPRFPGYGFVELGDGDRWMPINDTAGIARLLLTNGHPATLPAAEIERHMADDETLCDLTPETLPPIGPGTLVIIEGGAFAGRSGTVARCDGLATKVEIEIFGRIVPAGIARRALAVAAMED